MSVIVQMKPKTSVEKRTQTVVDTLMLTPELVEKWKAPPFQRPLKENKKVTALSETLKTENGVLPGVITLGVLNDEIYLLDGQHRVAAFKIAGLKEGYADIRKHYFTTMAEMGDEWVMLNSSLVRMNPDDILRGLESGSELLQSIRKKCPFIGYGNIRRQQSGPILSMSVALRCWRGSHSDVPAMPTGCSAKDIVDALSPDDANDLCSFMQMAMDAFGSDPEYHRLWGSLNLIMCMWLYRRIVKSQWSVKVPKLSTEHFRKCLVALSASKTYLDWLIGRMLSDRDRGPAYARIRKLFTDRLFEETGKRHMMPQPTWFNA